MWQEHFKERQEYRDLPVDGSSHTMSEKEFEEYCSTKLDERSLEIMRAVRESGGDIVVAGITREAISEFLDFQSWKLVDVIERDKTAERANRPPKLFNGIRPRIFKCSDASGKIHALMQCNPSREYVHQNGELVATVLSRAGISAEGVRRIHFPSIERSLPSLYNFTELFDLVDTRGHCVVMGDVDEIHDILREWGPQIKVTDWMFFGLEARFGYSQLTTAADAPLFLMIGVKESFWGTFSAQLTELLAEKRASHVFYLAKGAAIAKPENIRGTFHPVEYWFADDVGPSRPYRVVKLDDAPFSGLQHVPLLTIATNNTLRDTRHVSVPTVIGQTKARMPSGVAFDTVDIEISHMARAVADANKRSGSNCAFSALHFISDSLNPSRKVEVDEERGLADTTSDYYQEKRKALESVTRSVIIWSALTANERETTRALWAASERTIPQLLGNWEETFLLISRGIQLEARAPKRALELILLKCRYAPFYATDLSGLRFIEKHKETLAKFAADALGPLAHLCSYYDPKRARSAGSVEFEEDMLPRLLRTEAEISGPVAPYAKYVTANFYIQLASHRMEIGRNEGRATALDVASRAEVYLAQSHLLLSPQDIAFERLHLLRNRARIETQANAVDLYKELSREWSSMIATLDGNEAPEFVNVCRVHRTMCAYEVAKLLDDSDQTISLATQLHDQLVDFRRSSPLVYWADTRAPKVQGNITPQGSKVPRSSRRGKRS